MNLVPVFWAVALALVALTVAVLLRPLLRRRGVAAPSEEVARAAVYRDQKRQLDHELATGILAADEHERATAELSRRLGLELDAAAPQAAQAPARAGWVAALAAVAIIPVGAIVLYLALGAPEALRPKIAPQRPSDDQIVAMVESLATKMKANPGDPKGWRLLARSYAALGRYSDAAGAYAQAAQRGGEDADVLADWAEALALARNRTISGEPEALAKRALAREPDHPKALALLATAAFERRDFDASLALWRRLQQRVPPGGEDATQVAAAIAEIEHAKAASGPSSANASDRAGNPAPGAVPMSPPVSPPASSAASAASASPTPSTAFPAIAGHVEVAPVLAARVAAGDTLFVFARAQQGPRRPLAVVRGTAGELPRRFTLDDSMAMAGGPKLSEAGPVVVEARISKSGDAMPKPGDLVGRSGVVTPGAQDVRVVIDQVLP
jgi:cytochrome c-type biogenesis protein CcmH